jgi:hypothetical protein
MVLWTLWRSCAGLRNEVNSDVHSVVSGGVATNSADANLYLTG